MRHFMYWDVKKKRWCELGLGIRGFDWNSWEYVYVLMDQDGSQEEACQEDTGSVWTGSCGQSGIYERASLLLLNMIFPLLELIESRCVWLISLVHDRVLVLIISFSILSFYLIYCALSHFYQPPLSSSLYLMTWTEAVLTSVRSVCSSTLSSA